MFTRTLLAVSLSTCMMGSVYAQSLVDQPLSVQPSTALEPIAPSTSTPKATVTKTVKVTEVAQEVKEEVKEEVKKEKKFFSFGKKDKKAETPAPAVTNTQPVQPLEDIQAEETSLKHHDIPEPPATEPVKTVKKEKVQEVKEKAKALEVKEKAKVQEVKENVQPQEVVEVAISEPEDLPETVEPTTEPKTDVQNVEKLTLSALNNAQWSSDLSGVALQAFNAKAQVLLDNAHTTPGAIDGASGNKMSKAIRAFQIIHKLEKTNTMNQETWNKLVALQGSTPAFMEYTITSADTNKNLFVSGIPESYEEKSKMSGLKYTRVTELLGEKFHLHEAFLKELNPHAKFVAGEKIIVPNVHGDLPEDINLIIAMKDIKQVYLFNSKNQMVGSFPATVGKETTPSPSGTLKVMRIAKNPWYTKPGEKASLPAGPNTPVGNVWIALSKPSYGIHGTPEPSKISNDGQGSAGCVRLTNWDANRLANAVKPGVTVIFRDDSITNKPKAETATATAATAKPTTAKPTTAKPTTTTPKKVTNSNTTKPTGTKTPVKKPATTNTGKSTSTTPAPKKSTTTP